VNREYGIMARTPLHAAVFSAIEVDERGNKRGLWDVPHAVSELLEQHPEVDPMVADANGWTSMHYCCAYGRCEELSMILAQAQKVHPSFGASDDKENLGRQLRKPVDSNHGRFAPPRHRPEAETGRLQLVKQDGHPADPAKARIKRRARSAGYGGNVMELPADQHRQLLGKAAPASSSSALLQDHCRSVGNSQSLGALFGRTPAHLAAQAAGEDEVAAEKGENGPIECLRELFKAGVLEMEAEDERGLTPLLSACAAGSTTAVRWLLDRGADCYKVTRTKENALHLAISKGHQRTIRMLCRHDADTSKLKDAQDWKGRRPCEMMRTAWVRSTTGSDVTVDDLATLWEAARSGDVDELHAALRFVKGVDEPSPAGWTATMYASAKGHVAFVRRLIQLKACCDAPHAERHGRYQKKAQGGFDADDDSDRFWKRPRVRPTRGKGPLHIAAENGRAEICVLLCRHGHANLEAAADDGSTPLLSACRAGHAQVVEELLVLGAVVDIDQRVVDRNKLKDARDIKSFEEGGNPFMVLARGSSDGHVACIRLLTNWLSKQNGRSDGRDDGKNMDALMDTVDMLEHSVAELAASGMSTRNPQSQTRGYSALMRALRDAHRLCRGGSGKDLK